MPVCGLDFQSAPQIPLVAEAAAVVLPAVQAAVDLFCIKPFIPPRSYLLGVFFME
jgi:hypothetical protein